MLHWKKILCPVDFSDTSREAVNVAVELARKFDASVKLLHVYAAPTYALPEGAIIPTPDELRAVTDDVERALDAWKTKAAAQGAPVATATAMGIPFVEILRFARDGACDLIVMGTHGRTGLRHALLGSVAEKVVRKSPCPVLTIRPPNWRFELP